MCPLKREQARREMQQWVMRRLPTADSIVEIGRKSRSWIKTATGTHVPYGIIQCYLPSAAEVTFPPLLQLLKAGTRFSDPGDVRLRWPSWLGYITKPKLYTRPKTVTHASTNRAQRGVTSFMRRTTLPLRQTSNRSLQVQIEIGEGDRGTISIDD